MFIYLRRCTKPLLRLHMPQGSRSFLPVPLLTALTRAFGDVKPIPKFSRCARRCAHSISLREYTRHVPSTSYRGVRNVLINTPQRHSCPLIFLFPKSIDCLAILESYNLHPVYDATSEWMKVLAEATLVRIGQCHRTLPQICDILIFSFD